MEIDHIAIAVSDIEKGMMLYRKLGLKFLEKAEVKEEGVIIAFFSAGNVKIELIQPTEDNGVRRFIDNKGEGMHHISFRVKDVGKEMERLKELKFTSPKPLRRHGRNVCFVHPSQANGVLIELEETALYQGT